MKKLFLGLTILLSNHYIQADVLTEDNYNTLVKKAWEIVTTHDKKNQRIHDEGKLQQEVALRVKMAAKASGLNRKITKETQQKFLAEFNKLATKDTTLSKILPEELTSEEFKPVFTLLEKIKKETPWEKQLDALLAEDHEKYKAAIKRQEEEMRARLIELLKQQAQREAKQKQNPDKDLGKDTFDKDFETIVKDAQKGLNQSTADFIKEVKNDKKDMQTWMQKLKQTLGKIDKGIDQRFEKTKPSPSHKPFKTHLSHK